MESACPFSGNLPEDVLFDILVYLAPEEYMMFGKLNKYLNKTLLCDEAKTRYLMTTKSGTSLVIFDINEVASTNIHKNVYASSMRITHDEGFTGILYAATNTYLIERPSNIGSNGIHVSYQSYLFPGTVYSFDIGKIDFAEKGKPRKKHINFTAEFSRSDLKTANGICCIVLQTKHMVFIPAKK